MVSTLLVEPDVLNTVLNERGGMKGPVAGQEVGGQEVGGQEVERREVTVAGDDYGHLFRSRRLRAGDGLRVVDGQGRMRAARVSEVHRRQAVIVLGEHLQVPVVVPYVSIWSAMPRLERASWMVEKCTELGVREFVFFASEHAARTLPPAGVDRLKRVAKSALLQSGGGWLPEIRSVEKFSGAIPQLQDRSPTEVLFVLAPNTQPSLLEALERKDAPEASAALAAPQASKVSVVVGPEGGFTEEEVAMLQQVGVHPVGLGSQILRVETAAIVAAGNLLARGCQPMTL